VLVTKGSDVKYRKDFNPTDTFNLSIVTKRIGGGVPYFSQKN